MIDTVMPPLSIPADEALASLRRGERPHSAWRMLNDLDHFWPKIEVQWEAVSNSYSLHTRSISGANLTIEKADTFEQAIGYLWDWSARLLSEDPCFS